MSDTGRVLDIIINCTRNTTGLNILGAVPILMRISSSVAKIMKILGDY
jgi:hypothetical protein